MAKKNEKTSEKARREALFLTEKNGYDRLSEKDIQKAGRFCEDYKKFLDASKTERCAVHTAVELAEAQGFRPLEAGAELKPGDKVYRINRGKSLLLAVIGTQSLAEGVNIVASHIDSPRLDLKPNPLYESGEVAYFKTHYYGGIKKYQWPTLPLELRGVIAKTDGTVVEVCIGSDPKDPVLCITDLLPHLADEQYKKPLHTAIPGETLNVVLGSCPASDSTGEDRVKLAILELLHEKYDITEADLCSAELCLVPAGTARDVGLDRSLIGSYGHDDRVCAYTSLQALLEVKHPKKTAICVLADKEEIGSEGVSGMQSQAFDLFLEELCAGQGVSVRSCCAASFCLSADVTTAYDPTFPDVSDLRNTARLGRGIALCKYTGARGKSGASDASAEVVARIRGLLDRAGVLWQMSTLGKVDLGGGGTVAMYMANRNIDTLDAGVAMLSMHAPFELVSKLDVYETYRAYRAFYTEK